MSYPTDPTDPAAPSGPAPVRPGRALGILSVVILGVVAFVPGIAIMILAATVEPLIGWYFVLLIPVALAAAVLALVLCIVGLVAAIRAKAPFGWPVAGII